MSLERYSHATNSSDLGMSDWKTLDVDWIAAAGACQVRGDPLPAQVARWLAGDHRQVFTVMATLQKRYGKAKTLNNDARDDIMAAMAWWHDRACSVCKGRGHPTAPDTPILLEEDCLACRGAGLAPHDRTTDAYSWGLRELDGAASTCAYEVGAKVGLTREIV